MQKLLRKTGAVAILAGYLLSSMLFWQRFSVFGLDVNYHVVFAGLFSVTAIKSILNQTLSFRQSLFLAGCAIYVFILGVEAALFESADRFMPLRTAYTFLLILSFSCFVRDGSVGDADDLGIAAVMALAVLIVVLIARGLDYIELSRALSTSNFRAADEAWRQLYGANDAVRADAVVNLRNPLSAAIAVTCAISFLSRWPVMRLTAGIISVALIASLVSISGLIIVCTFIALFLLSFPRSRWIVWGSAGALICMVIINQVQITEFISNNDYLSNRLEGTTVERASHFAVAWQAIKSSHYLGQGPGAKIITDLGEMVPHNMFIAVWLNAGIPGFVLFCAFYCWALGQFLWASFNIVCGRMTYARASAGVFLMPFLVRSMISGPVKEFCDFGSAIGVGLFLAGSDTPQLIRSSRQ